MGEPEIVGGGSEKERVGKGILLPSSQNNYHEDTPKKKDNTFRRTTSLQRTKVWVPIQCVEVPL